MKKAFRNVGGLKPRRTAFDLSYSKLFDCDMGQLIPIFCDEVVPGDHFTINAECVIRMQPMVAPVLHEINIFTHYYFVPYRLLWDEWEDYITGGVEGNYTGTPPLISDFMDSFPADKGTLLDYLGFPYGTVSINGVDSPIVLTEDNAPMSFPVNAYNFVYNEYYRDQNLIEEVDLNNISILNRAWEKDYFTSSLPFIQRGTIPALPINTLIDGEFTTNVSTSVATILGSSGPWNFADYTPGVNADRRFGYTTAGDGFIRQNYSYTGTGAAAPYMSQQYSSGLQATSTASSVASTETELTALSTAFNVNDVRLAFQISKWQERNARAGVRYTEFLRAHYGTSPTDSRLDRPEYIGGTRSPVIVSEVLQTSSSDNTSPQGNLAGHGISVDRARVGKYHVQEFGLIIGLMSIMPKPSYASQGVNRQWLRRSRFDHYFKEFACLSEQEIFNAEIYAQGTNADRGIFGFQGRYDEMRVKQNMVCNNMRDTFDYWNLTRRFAELPLLNQSFIDCVPRKDIFAVQSEPGFIVHHANRVKAVRPMPAINEPGLIDHF